LPELAWTYQVLLFAVLSVGSIIAWQLWLRRHPTRTEDPLLNRRGHQYIGRLFTLDAPAVNGHGKIRVDDTTWKVLVERDCPAGTRLRIVGGDGVMLKGRSRWGDAERNHRGKLDPACRDRIYAP